MKVEEEYLDVLQNIEVMIIREYRSNPSLLDVDAADAVNALIRRYDAAGAGRRSAAGHKRFMTRCGASVNGGWGAAPILSGIGMTHNRSPWT